MELLLQRVVLLSEGGEFLGNPREFLRDGDQPSYEVG